MLKCSLKIEFAFQKFCFLDQRLLSHAGDKSVQSARLVSLNKLFVACEVNCMAVSTALRTRGGFEQFDSPGSSQAAPRTAKSPCQLWMQLQWFECVQICFKSHPSPL